MLLPFDAPDTVRAWMLGENPFLNDISPAEAIHDGRFTDARDAARSWIAEAYA